MQVGHSNTFCLQGAAHQIQAGRHSKGKAPPLAQHPHNTHHHSLQLDPNTFRLRRLYTKGMEAALTKHWDFLQTLYNVSKARTKSQVLVFDSWFKLLTAANLMGKTANTGEPFGQSYFGDWYPKASTSPWVLLMDSWVKLLTASSGHDRLSGEPFGQSSFFAWYPMASKQSSVSS